MYSKTKKASCLMLAVLVLFCACADVLTQPAEAVDPFTLTIAVGSAAVWLFGMLGLQFASLSAARDAADAFYNSGATVKADLDTLAAQFVLVDTSAKLRISPLILPVVLRLIAAVREFFAGDEGTVSVPTDFGTSGNVFYTTVTDFASASAAYGYTSYELSDYSEDNPLTFTANGIEIILYPCYSEDGGFDLFKSFRRSDGRLGSQPLSRHQYGEVRAFGWNPDNIKYFSAYPICTVRLGFSLKEIDGNKYLFPFLVFRGVKYNGEVNYFLENNTVFETKYGFCVTDIVLNSNELTYSTLSLNIEVLTAAIEALQTTMDETQQAVLDLTDIYNGLVDTAEGAQEDDDVGTAPYVPSLEWLKEMLRNLGLTDDVIADITNGAENVDVNNPAGSITLDEVDPDIPQLPDLRDKFPFCVPFDLIGCFQALNAKPEAPRFVVPLVYEPLDFSYDIVIDFAPFEKIAVVCRWVCTFSFLVFLALVTRKIIQA